MIVGDTQIAAKPKDVDVFHNDRVLSEKN